MQSGGSLGDVNKNYNGKREMNDGSNMSKRQWRESKFSSYTDLTEPLEMIYVDTRGRLQY